MTIGPTYTTILVSSSSGGANKTSAIATFAPASLRTKAPSAIFSAPAVRTRLASPSAIFSAAAIAAIPVSHTLTFSQVATGTKQFGNVVSFSQAVAVQTILNRTAAHSIVFSQALVKGITASAINQISFLDLALTNLKTISASNSFALSQTLTPQLALNLAFENVIYIGQLAKRGIEDSASNAMSFSNAAARGSDPVNQITFTDAHTVESGDPGTNTLGINHQVTVQKTLNITVQQTLTINQNVAAINEQACLDTNYDATCLPPISFSSPTSITLVCGGDNVTLRNPDFGNTETVELRRAFNRSRSGTPNVSRDTTHAKPIRLNFTVQIFTQVLRNDLLDFLENCLGELITLTDHEGRTRTGIIINPESAMSTLLDGNCGQYSVTIEMVVDP